MKTFLIIVFFFLFFFFSPFTLIAGTIATSSYRFGRYTKQYCRRSHHTHKNRICGLTGALSHARRAVPRGKPICRMPNSLRICFNLKSYKFSFQAELRSEERLAEEQKRHRELLARVEREAALQNENCQIKIKTTEIEANALREENQRLRLLCDKQANDLHRTEEKLELARDQIVALQQDLDDATKRERKYDSEKKSAEELMLELSKEVERLRAETGPAMPTTSLESIRLEELHQELEQMRQKNKSKDILFC